MIIGVIFFLELCHLPNELLISALEYLTAWWHTLLNCGHQKWLIGFPLPSTIILMLIILATFLLLHLRFTNFHLKTLHIR